MIDNLQKLGLTEKEAKIYYAALELGKATADRIAKQAEIIRSTSYTQLESLMSNGLITTYDEGKKTFYVAESPDNLKRILKNYREDIAKQENELSTILPSLNNLYKGAEDRPAVRMFKNKEGLIAMRNEVLKMKGKKLCVASSFDDFIKIFDDQKERDEYTEKRRKKGIEIKLLYTTQGDGLEAEFSDEVIKRVNENEFPFEFDVYIFDDKVAISSLKNSIWGLMIEGKAVANSMQSLFNIAWSSIK